MQPATRSCCAALLLSFAPHAVAQHSEISVLAGYTTSGEIQKTAPGVQGLQTAGAFTWGVEAGRFFTPRWGVVLSWARQESAVELTTRATQAEFFDFHADQVHASLAWQLGGADARVRPYLTAGAGASFLSASEQESEVKFTPALGAGFKWLPSGRIGARLQLRYNPTFLNDSSSDFCDPFGFCQSWLHQFELSGGLSIRF